MINIKSKVSWVFIVEVQIKSLNAEKIILWKRFAIWYHLKRRKWRHLKKYLTILKFSHNIKENLHWNFSSFQYQNFLQIPTTFTNIKPTLSIPWRMLDREINFLFLFFYYFFSTTKNNENKKSASSFNQQWINLFSFPLLFVLFFPLFPDAWFKPDRLHPKGESMSKSSHVHASAVL